MNVFIHSCFIHFGITGNEAIYDVELEVNNDNKYNFKLIDEVENVETPTEGMLFISIDELSIYYKSYVKQQGFGGGNKEYKKGCTWL
jgi:hypothetical protein